MNVDPKKCGPYEIRAPSHASILRVIPAGAWTPPMYEVQLQWPDGQCPTTVQWDARVYAVFAPLLFRIDKE